MAASPQLVFLAVLTFCATQCYGHEGAHGADHDHDGHAHVPTGSDPSPVHSTAKKGKGEDEQARPQYMSVTT